MDKKIRKIKYRTSVKHVDTTINGLKLDDIDKYFKIKSTLQTTKTNVEQINEENTTISHLYRNMEQYKED